MMKRKTEHSRLQSELRALLLEQPCGNELFGILRVMNDLNHGIPNSSTAKAWCENRETLLAEYIRLRPGMRPQAWWVWDAPELVRLVVRGKGEPASVGAPLHGRPRFWLNASRNLRLESEAAYLRRHELLSIAEQRSLTDADFVPEHIKHPSVEYELDHIGSIAPGVTTA